MSTVSTGSVQDLHFEHNLWMNELRFSADELQFFEGRLGVLVNNRSEREMLAFLEKFQNQFIRQKEVLDQLQHDIHVHEQQLSRRLFKDQPIEAALIESHQDMRERMDTFRKIFAELKSDFFQFLSKWI